MHFPVKFTTFANVNCMRFNGECRVGKAEKLKGISTWLGTFIPLMQFHEEVSGESFLVHQFSIDNSRKKNFRAQTVSEFSYIFLIFSLMLLPIFQTVVRANGATSVSKDP